MPRDSIIFSALHLRMGNEIDNKCMQRKVDRPLYEIESAVAEPNWELVVYMVTGCRPSAPLYSIRDIDTRCR